MFFFTSSYFLNSGWNKKNMIQYQIWKPTLLKKFLSKRVEYSYRFFFEIGYLENLSFYSVVFNNSTLQSAVHFNFKFNEFNHISLYLFIHRYGQMGVEITQATLSLGFGVIIWFQKWKRIEIFSILLFLKRFLT